uniref:F-box domain-containing protein n=2 Tax=Chenopodium quinoa TaxID=63459 RepID=A0A803LG12_CHEQI
MAREIIVRKTTRINNLPDESIATVISFTTPRDACRVATLSTAFSVVADSNIVWNRFLPSDYREIILRASNVDHHALLLDNVPKKDLFMYLADNPLLIDHGLMTVSLEKSTGKKCCTLSARKLRISWADSTTYWQWWLAEDFLPRSRFAEVARLLYVCWFEIKGEIKTSMLSPNTKYGAYLVFHVSSSAWNFYDYPVDAVIETSGGQVVTGRVYLDPRRGGIVDEGYELVPLAGAEDPEEGVNLPKLRVDEWIEVEIGEFFTGDKDELVTFSLMEILTGALKGGLVIEGIEIRPVIE